MTENRQLGMEFDVICVGSALLDMYMKSSQFVKVPVSTMGEGVALCEVFGGKTEISESALTSGGGGTNNAVSFARKGFKVGIIAEMGTDLVAAAIEQELLKEKVDTSMLVKEPDEETGMSAILVAPDGGRSVAVYRGASRLLQKGDIPWDRLYPHWLHISSLGGEMALLEGLLGHARTYGIKVALNLGKQEIERLPAWGGTQLLQGIELLLLNREEAALLLGKNLRDESIWEENWLIDGPKMTIVSDGVRRGKLCVNGHTTWYEPERVTMVEQTGAGDAFGSGMVAGLLLGKTIEESLGWAKKQAASVVSFMGPKQGLLSLVDLVR